MGNTMGGGGFSDRNEHFRDSDNLGIPDGVPNEQPEFGEMPSGIPNDMHGDMHNNRGERFNRLDRQDDALEAFNPFDGSAPPNMPNGKGMSTSNNASLLMLDISAVILLAGISTALLFQRQRLSGIVNNHNNGVGSHSQLRYLF